MSKEFFLNDVLLSHEQAEIEQTFNTLRSYLIIVFDIYRIRIDGFHNTAFEKLSDIRLVGRRWARKSHTTKVLSPERDRFCGHALQREEFIKRVYEAYNSKKEEFQQMTDLLPCWPQLIDESKQKRQKIS